MSNGFVSRSYGWRAQMTCNLDFREAEAYDPGLVSDGGFWEQTETISGQRSLQFPVKQRKGLFRALSSKNPMRAVM